MMSAAPQQLAVYIDVDRCVACYACEVACKQAHNLPVGPRLIRVISLERPRNNQVEVISAPLACVHCYEAPCVEVCPTKALSRRKEDGIVLLNRIRCIGCKMCLVVCPFGAPQVDVDGKMIKCDLCVDRLQKKKKPACVSACPVEALKFGTMEELSSMVREKWLNQMWKVKGFPQK